KRIPGTARTVLTEERGNKCSSFFLLLFSPLPTPSPPTLTGRGEKERTKRIPRTARTVLTEQRGNKCSSFFLLLFSPLPVRGGGRGSGEGPGVRARAGGRSPPGSPLAQSHRRFATHHAPIARRLESPPHRPREEG